MLDFDLYQKDLIASYEKLFCNPDDRITYWFGDMGIYSWKWNPSRPTEEQKEERTKLALAALGLTQRQFCKNEKYMDDNWITIDMCKNDGIEIPQYLKERPQYFKAE